MTDVGLSYYDGTIDRDDISYSDIAYQMGKMDKYHCRDHYNHLCDLRRIFNSSLYICSKHRSDMCLTDYPSCKKITNGVVPYVTILDAYE